MNTLLLTTIYQTMIKLTEHNGDIDAAIRQLGWDWCIEEECGNYLPGEAVVLTETQADALLDAAETLYNLMVEAVPDDVPDTFLKTLGIPENLWQAVRQSWNDDRHWHIYGRFDLAETPDGIKLLEFNADTATSVPETAVVQWASLAAAGKEDARQSSGLFEGMKAQLQTWREMNDDLEPSLLLTFIGSSAEDRTNCEVIAEAATEAGFDSYLCPIDKISVAAEGPDRGVWAEISDGRWQKFSFLFKLLPWEQIAWEEPQLAEDLTNLIFSRTVIVANPAYTLLFQSKAMLAWLWETYPFHPLLLEASFESLRGKHIRKPIFGREGQNLQVVEGNIIAHTKGEYDNQPQVYQRWADLPTDKQGYHYQAGVFWSGEGCAIGYRREKGLITNLSQFVPHLIEG